MNTDELTTKRLAALVSLVSAVPGQTLGRTAAVELMYFLQELKAVSLGYDFRLHTYGPFEPEVLHDLSTEKTLQLLTEKTVTFSAGYGYEIKPGPRAETIMAQAKDWLKANQEAITRGRGVRVVVGCGPGTRVHDRVRGSGVPGPGCAFQPCCDREPGSQYQAPLFGGQRAGAGQAVSGEGVVGKRCGEMNPCTRLS